MLMNDVTELSKQLLKIIDDNYPEFSGVHPACLAVPMCSQVEFDAIVASIKETGLDKAILRTKDHQLLDGRTRLLACYVAHQDIRVVDDPGTVDPWTVVKINNLDRRDLSTGQRADCGVAWLAHEKELAKQRQQEHGNTAPGRPKYTCGNVSTSDETGKARDLAGAAVGVSGKSIDKAAEIAEYAPDQRELMLANKTTLEAASKEAKRRKRDAEKRPDGKPKKNQKKQAKTTTIVTAAGVESEIQLPKKTKFNETNSSVDWAAWTWNPVTGCNHGCDFCYARELANSKRFADIFPNKFEPTFHEYRLAAPANTKRKESDNPRDGRVFVCSMADLFGKWVPDKWIRAVFDSCLHSPEWEYLFLTKWPARYSKMPLIERAWYGASVVRQSDVSRVEKAMIGFDAPGCVKWISLEPMLEPIVFSDLSWCGLMVIGAKTQTNQPDGHVPEFAPDFDWVVDVVNQCRDAGVSYFLKANLGPDRPGMNLPKMVPR